MGSLIEVQPVPGSGEIVRPEPFGGTIAFRKPEMLVLVDHRWLGSARKEAGFDPAAPFEAHLTLSNRCDMGCQGCYIDSGPEREELDVETWERIIEKLASLGVYHLALGGGELLSWDVLISLAHKARKLGMTPNLSTSGRNLTPAVAKRLSVFERIHLSLDGIEAAYAGVRGHEGFVPALMSLKILKAYHRRVGVNCVVARSNADDLEPLFRLLRGLGVRDLELLRFKPAGRGAAVFDRMNLTPRQAAEVFPRVLELCRRYRLRVRMDCSFTPMVCAAGYSPEMLSKMGLAGCVAGSWLVSVDPGGRLGGCSFDTASSSLTWRDLGSDGLKRPYRDWIHNAPEPCASCRFLQVCRGGCHVVARHVSGSFQAPDPGCPIVQRSSGS
jgi:radical SAM protein with 4Fe4S-binding SPASM domain